MIAPRQAPVRPRIVSPMCGEALPLADEVQRLLNSGSARVVALVGAPGAGKTTALAHLATVLDAAAAVRLVDESDLAALADVQEGQRVVYAAANARGEGAALRLAPWGRDEVIEYLLAVHKDRCAAVMARLRPQDDALCAGLPDLWRPVLDQLARDDAIPDARTALQRHVTGYLADSDLLYRTRSACLSALVTTGGEGPGPLERLVQHGFPPELSRALRHRTVQETLAADKIVADLDGDGPCEHLALRLPYSLVQAVGEAVGTSGECRERLRDMLAGPPWRHAMAASLLHAAGERWVPAAGSTPALRGAYLPEIAWSRVSLAHGQLADIDLTGADLREADLHGATAHRAALWQALLQAALLHDI